MLNAILDSGWVGALAAAGLGLLVWPFVEYLVHGILAHRFRTFVSPLHWGHHRTPAAVFTSSVAWMPIALAILGLSTGVAGLRLGGCFTAGLVAGFLHYEFVHWRIHFREPRTKRQALLRSHHLAHHFVKPKAYHGVTTRFWDHVFGTLPEGWENDYARAAGTCPLEGPSNLRASWSPAVAARIVAEAARNTSR